MKFEHKLFLSLLILTFLNISVIQAQRDSELNEENRFIENFDAIEVSGGIDVYLSKGSKHGLTVKASSDKIDKVITELKGDLLIIKMKSGTKWNWKDLKSQPPIQVYLTYVDLESITSSGGSDVFGQNTIVVQSLAIKSSGGSDVKLDLDVNTLICRSSGGSDLNLSGTAQEVDAVSSGGSDINARELEVKNCIILSSGGSDAKITVNGDLEVDASGASDVYIYGNPNIIRKRSSGSSDIHIR